jgi:protein SCO1/2
MKTLPLMVSALLLLTLSSSLGVVQAAVDRSHRAQKGLPAGQKPAELEGLTIEHRLGERVRIEDYEFRNEAGSKVKLAEYFRRGVPVVLSLVYFECPNICNFVLNGLTEAIQTASKDLGWSPGEKYEVLSLSIDPRETPEIANRKKDAILEATGIKRMGWHFLTAEESQMKSLASQLGFGYRWDNKEKQYVHGAAIFVLTPEGVVSRTLFGIQYSLKDFKLAVLEASEGKVGTLVEQFLLFCYRYDPQAGTYSLVFMRMVQVGAVLTVLALGLYVWMAGRRGRRKLEAGGW